MVVKEELDSLKILLVFPHYDSPDRPGSVRSWQIGRYLAGRGHDVTVIAPGVDMLSALLFDEMKGKLYAESQVDGVRLIRVYSLPQFRRSALHRLLFEIVYGTLAVLKFFVIPGVDIVVASCPPAVAPYMAYLMARIRRVPFVFEVRDFMAGALFANKYIRLDWFRRVAEWAERYLATHSDHVIAAGRSMERILCSRGVDESRMTLVEQGYEPEVFEAADYSWDPRQRYGWGDRFVVAYVGALNQTVDIPTLLEAAKRLQTEDSLLFVIVGDGQRKREYQQFCDDNSLDNCQFIGSQPRRQVPVFLAAANLGVNMLRDDPLWEYYVGNKVFDYWGSGLPILYSGIGELADLVREAGAGLVVEPENDQALAEAIMWFKTHPQEMEAMGACGRSFVLEHYLRSKVLEPLEPALVGLVRKQPRRPE